MSYFDIGFAVVSLAIALLVMICSPFFRAVLRECLLHPCSDGWIDVDDEGKVRVYRGETLPDYMLDGALEALEETHQAVEEAERKANQVSSASSEVGDWRSYAKATTVAGIAFLSAYLLRRNQSSSRGGN